MTPYEKASALFRDKKVLIFGLGLLGGASGDARFFNSLGAYVKATDLKTEIELKPTLDKLADLPIEYSLGGHQVDDFEWADYIVRNPSIPINHPLLQHARKLNKKIVMRSSLFVELAGIFTIGITGTRGKTTTTSMIFELVSQFSGKKTLLGGNISGVSDLELLSSIDDPDNTIAVMELSSWQLQGFKENNLSPNIAVLTNLYPDHLNKYASLDDYYADKFSIMSNQSAGDQVILNSDIPTFHQWAESATGEVSWYSASDISDEIILAVPGHHNRANAAAALKLAEVLNYPLVSVKDTIHSFKGVPYRLQTIAVKSDVNYVNDTTSTTPTATIAALQAISNPIIICGGADKNLPIEEMADNINHSTKAVIILPGDGTDRLLPLINQNLIKGVSHSMAEAVSLASTLAIPGDTVLLSPGFASFGLFNNEFDRGNQFNQCVQTLS